MDDEQGTPMTQETTLNGGWWKKWIDMGWCILMYFCVVSWCFMTRMRLMFRHLLVFIGWVGTRHQECCSHWPAMERWSIAPRRSVQLGREAARDWEQKNVFQPRNHGLYSDWLLALIFSHSMWHRVGFLSLRYGSRHTNALENGWTVNLWSTMIQCLAKR